MRIERLAHQPIIRPHMDDQRGKNINGPSLSWAPDGVARPLGRYYLYFAHRDGHYILSTIDLTPDWHSGVASEPVVVLEPERVYEGKHLPREPSKRGLVRGLVCQLRDPAIFCDEGQMYLLYAVAGEQGIAMAALHG